MPSPNDHNDAGRRPCRPARRSGVSVPDVRGQKVGDARKQLREEGLVLEIRKVPNALPKNTVVCQSPHSDTAAKRGDHVLVTVSMGKAKAKNGKGAGAVGALSRPPFRT